MGKQSSRLIYRGIDHKELFYAGKFHDKLYKGNTLVWEKIYPDNYFVLGGQHVGISVFDVKEKIGSDIARDYVINMLGCTDRALIGYCYPLDDKVGDHDVYFCYSYDSVKWKKIEGIRSTDFMTLDGVTSDSCRIHGDGKYAFVNLNDGSFVETQIYIYPWKCAKGLSNRYVMYRQNNYDFYTDIVDAHGNTLYSYTQDSFLNNSTGITYWVGGASLYFCGTQIYGIARERSAPRRPFIMKMNENGQYVIVDRLSNKIFHSSYSLYFDENRTVVIAYYYENNSTDIKAWIYEFTESGYRKVTENTDGITIKNAITGEKCVLLFHGIISGYMNGVAYDTYIVTEWVGTLNENRACSAYIKGRKLYANPQNGFCFEGELRKRSTFGEFQRVYVYIDNIYLNESEGNYFVTA